MIGNLSLHLGALLLAACLSLSVAAQSDGSPSASPRQGVVPDRPLYRLVFGRERPGRLDVRDRDVARIRSVARNAFMSDLNDKAEDGYRLVSVLIPDLIGMVALDESPYEYQMFESVTDAFFGIGDLEERLVALRSKNTSLVAHAQLFPECTPRDRDNIAYGDNCEYTFRFITEKQRGPVTDQTVVSVVPGWGRSPTAELESAIAAKLREGYYPARIISRFAVLLQKVGKGDEIEQGHVKVLRTAGNTKNLLDDVNRHAADGYRLALIDDGVALMLRSASVGTTYHFLEGDRKDFAKQFDRISSSVKFITTYPDRQGEMKGLVFESLKSGERSRQYRFLQFDRQYSENSTRDKILAAIKPDESEFDKAVADLVKRGFRPRTLFVSRPFALLMESE